MTKPRVLLLFLLLLGAVAAGIYLWRQSPVSQSEPSSPPTAETSPPATPTPTPEPAIRHPIEQAASAVQTPAAPAPLPTLADSDSALNESLAALFSNDVFRQVFNTDEVVRRFVVTVDNLPRPKLPAPLLPVKVVPGPFAASAAADGLMIGADNEARYTRYVSVAEAVDTKRLVSTYVHFYPLFQQMYQTLGYPHGYFNDRLIVAIDDLLAAPEPEGTITLVQPKVLYQFADPALEALSSGQKTMVRMGLANERRLKEKLRDIRRTLTQVVPAN